MYCDDLKLVFYPISQETISISVPSQELQSRIVGRSTTLRAQFSVFASDALFKDSSSTTTTTVANNNPKQKVVSASIKDVNFLNLKAPVVIRIPNAYVSIPS